ncbi:LegC family aminotransferase [Leptospira gomenensis]|uniref:GDP-perosamine synthase n=1 Tax=Leptospira gomenensis TaxID=2484974 RepID=A0A5F1Y7M7_9LEPT|nr:LegC family aminotransferase [Leptospira gomenensis]TGK30941.1 LegC family aminotransferase [Leptospira gomenensis]TGK38183.1 LegC family aminotransferase [Leptospira gomenensis]TGK45339.1 LegC family aminotransferase [Leptospira gomenensis]TGK66252.1 LegC family aminotransferase [Leptospira gomenensis]
MEYSEILKFIRSLYPNRENVPLHEPVFSGNEKSYLAECIDSTFVSSVGKYVDEFEKKIAEYTGAKKAIAVVNGTQALFITLKLAGVEPETEVLTQSLTFIATANAIQYTGAIPHFLDVDPDTMGLSPEVLSNFLKNSTHNKNGKLYNRVSGRAISAVVPMHTLGHPCRISEIARICEEYSLPLVEDAAESLGSFVDGKHTGRFGLLGTLSFNGNKVITTGGGGMILTDDEETGVRAKHLTTTAKLPHRFEFIHDEVGYNFRLPNINAALGVAQMEKLPRLLESKREIAERYADFFSNTEWKFVSEPPFGKSNYWLNSVQFRNHSEKDEFLNFSNDSGVATRSLWRPMHRLSVYASCPRGDLRITDHLYDTVVNLPSSARV